MKSIVKVTNDIVPADEIIDAQWWNVPESKTPDEWESWGPAENAEYINFFGGAIPNDVEELQDWILEYSNRTGFTGRLFGYNVRPEQRRVNIGAVVKGVVKVTLLVFLLAVAVRLFL
jgi:hypothetical protein